MCAPIASEDVAAGDGALRTWITRPLPRRMKSSESLPSRVSACALMPLGPPTTSVSEMAGRYRCTSRTKARFEMSRQTSAAPAPRWLVAKRQKPGYVNVAATSRAENQTRPYRSRARANTAFGPATTVPSTCLVKWTPRNGNAGFGTGYTNPFTRPAAWGESV